jgi:hypothetical protein
MARCNQIIASSVQGTISLSPSRQSAGILKIGVTVHASRWRLQTGRREPFIDTIRGMELPDFLQNILMFLARRQLCRQSFESLLFIRDLVAERVERG